MTRKWNDLTQDEQWLIARECQQVRKKYEHIKERAFEDAEDGYGEPLYRVNTQIKAEINQIRNKHGLEPL